MRIQLDDDDVPDVVIDSFFGNRLITATFGFVNGISIDQLFVLYRCNDTEKAEEEKMKKLYTTCDTLPASHFS